MRITGLVAAVALLAACGARGDGNRKKVRVSAAASAAKALEELAPAFRFKTGIEPVLSFQASGMLARQIKEGAPVDLYMAANVEFVDLVIGAGKCDPATKAIYARGRLVMWLRDGGVAAPTQLADLVEPRFKTIAIASPDTAPYGKAAKQAMERLGIWAQVEGRMKYGEDVRKTLQFAETGNVDVAFIALALAMTTTGGKTIEVPGDLHDPIDQALVACGSGAGHANAKAFAEYLGSPEGRAIMMKHGFILPGESGP